MNEPGRRSRVVVVVVCGKLVVIVAAFHGEEMGLRFKPRHFPINALIKSSRLRAIVGPTTVGLIAPRVGETTRNEQQPRRLLHWVRNLSAFRNLIRNCVLASQNCPPRRARLHQRIFLFSVVTLSLYSRSSRVLFIVMTINEVINTDSFSVALLRSLMDIKSIDLA